MHGTRGLSPSNTSGVSIHLYPCTLEVETRGSRFGHPQIYRESKVSLDKEIRDFCLKERRDREKERGDGGGEYKEGEFFM